MAVWDHDDPKPFLHPALYPRKSARGREKLGGLVTFMLLGGGGGYVTFSSKEGEVSNFPYS